jgi:hypothetical protein
MNSFLTIFVKSASKPISEEVLVKRGIARLWMVIPSGSPPERN